MIMFTPRSADWLAIMLTLLSLLTQACSAEFEYSNNEHPTESAETEHTSGWAANLGEFFWPLIEKHDTEYSPSFSEESFRSLNLGSRAAEAEKALGHPLEVKEFADGETYWYYSRPGPEFENYFVRILVFSQNGRLIAKRSFFHID